MKIEPKENVSLANLTTFKSGGLARFLVSIKRKEDLEEVCKFAYEKRLPTFILGGGSNVLISDSGFSGVVIKMETKGVSFAEEGDHVLVASEAGEPWDELVKKTVERGLWGFENLSAIPGTVGASAVQNIGAYGVEVRDLISEVEVFDKKDLSFKILKNEDCEFGYRESVFKKENGKDFIVTKVFFKLSKNGKPNVSYKDLLNFFSTNEKENINPESIREEVVSIRSKKFPDMSVYGTAGSFFKNLIVDEKKFQELKLVFADIVSFEMPDGKRKLSTASILDKVCGLKGYREGNVGLFENQPLVVVNFGKASTGEIKKFVENIKEKVKEKISVELEEEVVIVS